MKDLFADEPDVDWTCVGGLLGEPLLAVQTTSPALSAGFLGLDVTSLKVQVLVGIDPHPNPATFVLHQGNVLEPLLACPMEELLDPILRAVERDDPWVLVLQFLVEGEECSRMFVVEKDAVTPVQRGDVGVIPTWPVKMVG